jgi:hypothetical protein
MMPPMIPTPFRYISRLFHLGLAALLLACAPLWAAEVTGLYEATVNVDSRDDARERARAFATAMREVLVRLTGRDDVLDLPELQPALNAPQPYVETWVYQSLPSTEAGKAEQLVVRVSFYRAEVQRLLDGARVPIWPASRPETLLWVVIQDTEGQRYLADDNTSEGAMILDQLHAAAKRRAMPLLNPLLDFDDRRALRADQVWDFDQAAILGASSRYKYESVLALRVLLTPSGAVLGKSMHLFRQRAVETEALDATLDEFVQASVAMAAEELAGNYAVLLSSNNSGSTVINLHVEGVDGLSDYAGLLQYLEGLAVVQDVQVTQVDPGSVQLQLSTSGQVRQLVDSMAIGRKLQALAQPTQMGQVFSLQYRWQAL